MKLREFFRAEWMVQVSAGILAVFFVLAVGGYLFTADTSTHCNEQYPELSLAGPLTRFYLMDTSSQEKTVVSAVLDRWLQGVPGSAQRLVADTVLEHKDTLWYQVPNEAQWHMVENAALVEIQERTYWLGADIFGRDLMSRLILGARVSLVTACLSTVLSLLLGIILGLVAGYYQGWPDKILQLWMSVFWSLPAAIVAFLLTLLFGRSVFSLSLAMGLTLWVDTTRLVRNQTLFLSKEDYVLAGKVVGLRDPSLMFRYILPNLTGYLAICASQTLSTAILLEAGLSYLGFGIQPPVPSWGNIIYENYGFALSGKFHLALVPSLLITVIVLSFNILGNRVRDIMDVKGSRKSEPQ